MIFLKIHLVTCQIETLGVTKILPYKIKIYEKLRIQNQFYMVLVVKVLKRSPIYALMFKRMNSLLGAFPLDENVIIKLIITLLNNQKEFEFLTNLIKRV